MIEMNATRKVMVTAAIAAVAAAGCSSAPQPQHKRPATHTARPVAAAAPLSCHAQLIAWVPAGVAALKPVMRDMQLVGTAAESGDLGVVQGAADQLSNDSRSALSSKPPACIPGLRVNWDTAMHDFIAASRSTNLGTLGGIQTATLQIGAGAAAIKRSTRDLSKFEGS